LVRDLSILSEKGIARVLASVPQQVIQLRNLKQQATRHPIGSEDTFAAQAFQS
jgi:hypothetical protein